jgi:hypothetical protein
MKSPNPKLESLKPLDRGSKEKMAIVPVGELKIEDLQQLAGGSSRRSGFFMSE